MPFRQLKSFLKILIGVQYESGQRGGGGSIPRSGIYISAGFAFSSARLLQLLFQLRLLGEDGVDLVVDVLDHDFRFEVDLVVVFRAATFNPAKAIGAADKVGTIETGKLADFVVTNADYTQKRVFIGGKEI